MRTRCGSHRGKVTTVKSITSRKDSKGVLRVSDPKEGGENTSHTTTKASAHQVDSTHPILLVLYHRHYCYSHSYFRHKDYCTMHPTVLCSINTESLWYMLWSTISFWLCSRQVAYLSHYLNNTISFWLCSSLCITPTTASSGYGSCPQELNQDFNHTCIFQMWVSLSSLLTVGGDEAAVGVMCRLKHSQRKIVLQSIHGPVFILQSIIGCVVQ